MLSYRMADGEVFTGRSFREIVCQMAGSKMRRPRNRQRYRESVARRVLELYQVEIRTGSDERFIRDLVHHRLMEPM